MLLLPVLALAALCAYAQTITTTNNAGQSIIEAITVNPQGITLTQTLQTLTTASTISTSSSSSISSSSSSSSSSSTTATATTTTPDGQQGPVASPDPTTGTPGGPTPYVYTTTNAAGQTVEVSDTFTPSFASTNVLPSVTSTGTILQYTQWLSMVGSATATATGASNLKNGAQTRCDIGPIAVFGSFVGGLLVLL